MRHLLAVGACCVDTILDVDHFPVEDEKLSASGFSKRRGGNTPNTVDVLQQLLDVDGSAPPLTLSLCAVMPAKESPGYAQLRSSFERSVDLSHCIFREDCTEPVTSYIIRSSDARTIINHNALQAMSEREFIHVAEHLGQDLQWCHFEGRNVQTNLLAMRYLRTHRPDVKISVEVEKPNRDGLQALAESADVVFYSKTWAEGNGYKSPRECLLAQSQVAKHASLLFCTWGSSGAAALEIPSMKITECEAFHAMDASVMDTLGAGDTFIAGILFGIVQRASVWNVGKTLSFANELAGRKVVQEGFGGLGELMIAAIRDL